MQRHVVRTARVIDHQARLANLRMPRNNRGDLRGMNEDTLDLGRLVGASQPAFDAHVGSATRADAGEYGREVTGGKTDQRIIRIETGDDDFADFAVGHRIARSRTNDFEQNLLFDDQPLFAWRFVGDNAKVCRGIGLTDDNAAVIEQLAHGGR